jgi:molybdenum cofactor biosynthesis enzyme MoaA
MTQKFEHSSTSSVWSPENNPFESIMVDLTHRCNMECRNCYIPNREIPDLDVDWMLEVLARLPRRTRIRLVGAEPTVRKDLAELITSVRQLGHLPILMTNGLKLARRSYVQRLKGAGLRTVYLSVNGGFDDEAYYALDDLRCAGRKTSALSNLCSENMYASLGMILARGVNEHCVAPVFDFAKSHRQVRELHFRSIGRFGRWMEGDTYNLNQLHDLFTRATGECLSDLDPIESGETYVDYMLSGVKIQLTEWPDLGSSRRGRLAPDGTIQPFFEHMIANEGSY